jgi:hypothetical protein
MSSSRNFLWNLDEASIRDGMRRSFGSSEEKSDPMKFERSSFLLRSGTGQSTASVHFVAISHRNSMKNGIPREMQTVLALQFP